MKCLSLVSLAVILCLQAVAQAPQGINYQAVIRTSSGQIVPTQAVGLKLVIRQGSASGSIVYEETHATQTNNLGLVNVVMGNGTALTGNFTAINWGIGPYWVEVSADISGGTNYIVLGTQQLMSVPYALYAANAGSSGVVGPTGPTGPQGAVGPAGAPGPQGVAGPTGPQGPGGTDAQILSVNGNQLSISNGNTVTLPNAQGTPGPTGPTGPQGPAGAQGAQGLQGVAGPAGAQGPQGVAGPAGPQGAAGPAGPQGAQGPQGPQGPTQTLSINGNQLTISNGNTVVLPSGGSGGGTLDQAYDFGGAGAGRIITSDAGAVEINLSGGDTRALKISSAVANSFGVDITSSNTGVGLRAQSLSVSNALPAIQGETNSNNANNSAIIGQNTGAGYGVSGQILATATGGAAVYGNNLRTTGGIGVSGVGFNGVSGSSNYNQGFGVFGQNNAAPNIGSSFFATAVAGLSSAGVGVQGQTQNGQLRGVFGQNLNTGIIYNNIGVQGSSSTGIGVWGENLSNDYYGVYANGQLGATGTKSFMIDHPKDPENKFLKHFSIESDEVLNLYRGTVTLDNQGQAVVALPEYVEWINRRYTYQLTCIGDYAPVYISEKVKDGTFAIAGGKPGMEVSWQLTAERNDLYMQKYPVQKQVIVDKREGEKGKYLIPELYNKPAETKMGYLGTSPLRQPK